MVQSSLLSPVSREVKLGFFIAGEDKGAEGKGTNVCEELGDGILNQSLYLYPLTCALVESLGIVVWVTMTNNASRNGR